MLADFFRLSIQNLTRRKIRSYLTMIGIFIGIAAVVALIGLGQGLRYAITNQFSFLGTDTISIQASGLNIAGPPGTGSAKPLSDELAPKVAKINGVKAAINRYIKGVNIQYLGKSQIAAAMSMPGGDDRKLIEDMLNVKTMSGRLLKDGDTRKVLLGNRFANEDGLGLKTGDKITLNDIPYEVIGIMEKKGSFILDSAVIINEDTLLKDFGDDGTVSVIGVKVFDEKDIPKIKEDIEKLLRKERGVKVGEEDFSVETPQQILESLDSTLFAVQLFVTIIAAISLIVGGIGIMNTMYTSVLERTREIGILKSIGARNSMVFKLFFIESGLLGLIGGITGVILGLIMAYGLAAAGRIALGANLIQAHVSVTLIIGALLFSFSVGLIAGLTPAIQAARKNPVDALRYSK